jgi:hypothetical protein
MSTVAEDVESDEFRSVGGKVFRLGKGVWVDTEYRASLQPRKVSFLSDEYFSLLGDDPTLGQYLALVPTSSGLRQGSYRIISDISATQ